MDYQKLFFTYDGRINRTPFWIGGTILSVINIVVQAVIHTAFGNGLIGAILLLIISLFLIYPSLCVAIKRYHDRDKSGWWCLILLIPLVGIIWYIIDVGCLRGTIGPNRFGPDPLS